MTRTSYRTYLRGIGRKPVPPSAIARPVPAPGAVEIILGKVYVGGKPKQG